MPIIIIVIRYVFLDSLLPSPKDLISTSIWEFFLFFFVRERQKQERERTNGSLWIYVLEKTLHTLAHFRLGVSDDDDDDDCCFHPPREEIPFASTLVTVQPVPTLL